MELAPHHQPELDPSMAGASIAALAGGLGGGGLEGLDPVGGGDSDGAVSLPAKRGRGRPQGSKNKIAKVVNPMLPHVMIIKHGEDVQAKLRELARSYRRCLVVLAASGNLSVATLTQVGANGQSVGVTLRGQFTILSISGALLYLPLEEVAGMPKRQAREPFCAFLSASLANPTGGVVGGTVAGAMEASGSVTLVIAHWDPDKTRMGAGLEEVTPSPPHAVPPPAAAAQQQPGAGSFVGGMGGALGLQPTGAMLDSLAMTAMMAGVGGPPGAMWAAGLDGSGGSGPHHGLHGHHHHHHHQQQQDHDHGADS